MSTTFVGEWKAGQAGGYGDMNNPQILLEPHTSGQYRINLKRKGQVNCGLIFFLKRTETEELEEYPSSSTNLVAQSEFIIYESTSVSAQLNSNEKYIIIPCLQTENHFEGFEITVVGPAVVTMKNVQAPESVVFTGKWTKEMSGGVYSLSNPQFEFTVQKEGNVSFVLTRADKRAPTAGLNIFVCKSAKPGSRRKQVNYNEEKITAPYLVTNVLSFTYKFEPGVTYIVSPSIGDRSQCGFTLKFSSYVGVKVIELPLETQKLKDNGCEDILKQFQNGSDLYYETNPVDTITEYLLNRNELFVDKRFPPTLNSANWDDGRSQPEIHPDAWLRVNEVMDNPDVFVNGIDMSDINQGGVGNCWLCQGIAGITCRPDLVESMIYPRKLSPVGIYSVRLHINGKALYVIVDDYMPTKGGSLMFIQSKDNNEIWTMLIEKAFAKHFGSYRAMASHSMGEALETLSGGEYKQYHFDSRKNDPTFKDELWNDLILYTKNKWLMALSCDKDNRGMVGNHAYSLLAAIEVPWANLRLCKLRNTWGWGEFTGDYSDKSSKWTPDLKEYVGYVDKDDGVFYMTLDDLVKFCSWAVLCKILQDVQYKYRNNVDITGEWKSANGFRYKDNTRVILSVPQDSEVIITCTKIKATPKGNDTHYNRMYLALVDPQVPSQYDDFYSDSEIIEEQMCNTVREYILVEKHLKAGKYYLVPYLERGNHKGEFTIAVNSQFPVELELDSQSGSSSSNVAPKWVLNPSTSEESDVAEDSENTDFYQPCISYQLPANGEDVESYCLYKYYLQSVTPELVLNHFCLKHATGVVVVNDEIYIVADYLWKVQGNSMSIVSQENKWSDCVVRALNGKIYAISQTSGRIFCWDTATSTYETLSLENWKPAAFCAVEEDGQDILYIYCDYIYRFDVKLRTYDVASTEGGWSGQTDIVTSDGNIYSLDTSNGRIYCWNIESKTYRLLSQENWTMARPMIPRESTQLVFLQGSVWTVYTSDGSSVNSDHVELPWTSVTSTDYQSTGDYAWILATPPIVPATGDVVEYQATIRLMHVESGCVLHSHTPRYNTGSFQQEVTCFEGSDMNDFWIIRGADGNNGATGPVRHDDIVRLTHSSTGANLHTHQDISSPATQQQETTAFGENGRGDSNDNWKVDLMGNGDVLTLGMEFRLLHVNTGYALHSHAGHYTPVTGQQEVTSYWDRDSNDYWVVDCFAEANFTQPY